MADWSLPMLPALCTLDASQTYLPHLDRRRLPDCYYASGITLQHAHSALGDTRATAALLRSYLDSNFGFPTRPDPTRARTASSCRHVHLVADLARRRSAADREPAPARAARDQDAGAGSALADRPAGAHAAR